MGKRVRKTEGSCGNNDENSLLDDKDTLKILNVVVLNQTRKLQEQELLFAPSFSDCKARSLVPVTQSTQGNF